MRRLTHIWLLLMLTLTVSAQSFTSDTTIYICDGGAVVLMSPSAGETYMWVRNGEPYPRATRSVIDTAVVDTVTYVCMVIDLDMVYGNNLMDGGDFESRTGFTSDYKYVANTPSYYSSHSGDYDLYKTPLWVDIAADHMALRSGELRADEDIASRAAAEVHDRRTLERRRDGRSATIEVGDDALVYVAQHVEHVAGRRFARAGARIRFQVLAAREDIVIVRADLLADVHLVAHDRLCWLKVFDMYI